MAPGLQASPGPGGGAQPGRGRQPAHRVVVRVQVGHEHSGEGAQELVYFVPVVAAQLPEGAFPAVQQQGRIGAMGGDGWEEMVCPQGGGQDKAGCPSPGTAQFLPRELLSRGWWSHTSILVTRNTVATLCEVHGAYLELHRCWAPKGVSAEGEGEDMKSTRLY